MQRNAMGYGPYLSFTMLAISLVVSLGSVAANAQQSEDSNSSGETALSGDAQTTESAVVPANLLVAKPVVLAPAMNSPAPAPTNVSSSSNAVANSGTLSAAEIKEAAGSAISGSGLGLGLSDSSVVDSRNNQNGSGIQIFNLNNNKSDLENQNKMESTTGTRADMLRRERIRQELMNESRLIEKIEEDRIEAEGARSNSIEGLKFTNHSAKSSSADASLQEVQVAAVSHVAYAPVNSVSAVSTTSSSSVFSSTQFRIAPMGGYRWTQNNNSQFRSENRGVVGVALEGRLANIFGLEANYMYGHDFLEYGFGGIFYNNYMYNLYNSGQYGFVYNIRTRDTHEFNANAKLGWFVGSVQPYIMGGFGAMYTAYNIDDPVTKKQAASIGWKRSSTHLVGNSGVGLDFVVAKNLSVGTRVEYQYIFGTKFTANPWDIINIYGDTKNKIKALGSLQLIF